MRGKRLVVAIETVLVALSVFAMDSSSSSGTLLFLGRKKETASLRVPALRNNKEQEYPLTALFYLNQTRAFDLLIMDGESSSALVFFNYVLDLFDYRFSRNYAFESQLYLSFSKKH